MTTVIVVCEGRTEAAFVEKLLQPRLAHDGFDRWLTCIETLPTLAPCAS